MIINPSPLFPHIQGGPWVQNRSVSMDVCNHCAKPGLRMEPVSTATIRFQIGKCYACCAINWTASTWDWIEQLDDATILRMMMKWGPGKLEEKAFHRVMMGDRVVDLHMGQYPHSRSDNTIFAKFDNGKVEGFNGHRILWDVEVSEYNYLKQSGLSGDEVRPGCTVKLFLTSPEKGKEQVYEGFHRNVESGLIEARDMIRKLEDCPFHIWDMQARDKIVGCKIWWRDQPAKITELIIDQGCVMIEPDGKPFGPVPYRDEDQENDSIKADITDPHIWWYRD